MSAKMKKNNLAHRLLLVGSVGLADAEEVFRNLAATFGSTATRYPDGETGARGNWIRWQEHVIKDHPQFDGVQKWVKLSSAVEKVERRYFKLRPEIHEKEIEFGPLGYASHAIESYHLFSRLKREGTILPDIVFQVALPTPVAFLTSFVVLEDRAKVEAAYRRAMKVEIENMLATIPPSELAIQWDVCYEVVAHDGGCKLFYDDILKNSLLRIAQLSGDVPKSVELGFHLCYGDPGHRHIIEPTDSATLVAFANGICAHVPRAVNWIHLPVPRERVDDAFYAPFSNLELGAKTELYLGLVHHSDGTEGTARRLAAAKCHIAEFGIAAECGFGRRDPETIPELLRIHLLGQGI